MQEQELSLRDYVEVVKRRKKTILLVFFIAIIGSAVLSFVLPPVYQVESTIKVGSIIDVDTLEKELIESPIAASQFLKGPQILIDTIKELKLPYTFEELGGKILIEPVRETEDLVQIKVDVNDPGEAVNIVNYLGTKLLDRHEEIKKLYENKEEILARYDEQITDINQELDEIDKSKEEIIVAYDQEITDINQELDEVDKSKEEIIAGYDQEITDINQELDEINKSKEAILVGYVENIQSINNQITSLKNDIDEAKEETAKLEVSLEVVSKEVEERMKSPESLSDAEANLLMGRLEYIGSRWESSGIDAAGKQQRHDGLLEKLREIKLEKIEFEQTKDQHYNVLSGELRRIEQEKVKFQATKEQRYVTLTGELRQAKIEKTKLQTTKEQRYDTLTGELRQAKIEKTRLERVDSVKMYNTEVLAAAEEPRIPIKPNKLLNILVAAVVSLIVGLGLAFSLEYFEKTD